MERPEGTLTPTAPPSQGAGNQSQLRQEWIDEARELLKQSDGSVKLRDVARVLWCNHATHEAYASEGSFYQALLSVRKRGWQRERPPAPYKGRIPEWMLSEAAWRYYIDEWGFQHIARWLARRFPEARGLYNDIDDGLTNGLHGAFVKLGWPRRDRIEATNIASFKHGLAPRKGRDNVNYERWKKQGRARPRCKGTVRNHSRRHGGRCAKAAIEGSDYCYNHDPAREAERDAYLVKMREASHAVVDIMPFTHWLVWEAVKYPTVRAFAEKLGMDNGHVGHWLKGKGGGSDKPIIKPATIEKALANYGGDTTFADLYPEGR
jgi:hypothetical protein